MNLLGRTAPQIEPRSTPFAISGHPAVERRRAPPFAPPPALPFRPRPPDRDRTVRVNPSPGQIGKVTVSATIFAKEPLRFMGINPQSSQFKSISSLALFLAFRPLSFLVFEPAVQPGSFCELDPDLRFNYL